MSGPSIDPAYPFQPGPYQGVLTGAHREVCGEESAFRETFNDFMSRLASEGTPAERRILQDIMRKQGANPRAAAAAYRRFLNRGEKCPKFSPGHERWTKIRDARPVAPGSLAAPDNGDIVFLRDVVIGEAPHPIYPRKWSPPLVIPAEDPPLSPAGVPQLSRLGEIAYDRSGPPRLFGDVIEVPANPAAGTSAITVVRGMDGYSASILLAGVYVGDVSLIDDYARRVGAIEDPHLLLAAWNDYVRDLSWRMQEYASAVEDIAEAYEEDRGELKPNRPADILFLIGAVKERVSRAQTTLRAIVAASTAFHRQQSSPTSQSWEYMFLRAQLAKIDNHVGPILSWDYGSDTLEEVGASLADLRKNLALFFDPFDHLHFSYEIDPLIGRRINVTLGEGRPGAPAANPVALRRIVDEIVYQAGLASPGGEGKGQLRIEWNQAAGELSFADVGEGGLLFDAFQGDDSRPLSPLVALLGLVSQLGTGANFHIDTDPSDGHVTAIRVAVPLVNVLPTPEGGGGAGGDSPSEDGTGTPGASPSSPTSTASAFGGVVHAPAMQAAGTPEADLDGASPDPWAIPLTDPAFLDGAAFPGFTAVPVPPASPVAP